MNDLLFAQELAAVLATYEDLAPVAAQIHAAQSGSILARPTLTLSGTWTHYVHRRVGTLQLELRSRVGDETAGAHQSLFEALFVALFGEQGSTRAVTFANQEAAKVALKSALSTRGKVAISDYGTTPSPIEETTEGEDLVTTLSVGVAWEFLPQV